MWRYKDCERAFTRRSELLRHYKLNHRHYGRGHSYPCTYSNCACRFKTWNTLLSHLSRTLHYSQRDLERLTMAVLVIWKEGEGLKEPPEDIGIVIDGVEVLHDLTSVASACALLLGLIYVLNLAYPKHLHFTFEVFQKIIMQLEQHKMSPKVQNLYGRLQSSQ